MYVYLGLNGFRFEAPEEEVVTVILSLASGEIEETQLAEWLRGHLSPR
jgi:death-on-curing protein